MSEESKAEQTPARAGTVLVVDAEAGTVLLLRRRESLRFMGGFWVFPGGAVDDADDANGVASATGAGSDDTGDGGGGTGRPLGQSRAFDIAAAARAACRELHEEAGLRLEPRDLVHWAHWITPASAWRRFDTHFFLALRPPGQVAHLASTESSDLRWVPAEWTASEPSDFPVTAPTALELRTLSELLRETGSADALLSRARSRTVRTVMPKLAGGGAVMPWDVEYSSLPGPGIDWDESACTERAGWRSRWPAAVTPRQ